MLSQVSTVLIWIAFFPLLALVPAYIAHRKGYNFFLAWLLSLVFPPLALIVVLVIPKFKVCGYCLERIKAEATACRFCGRWQAATPDPLAQSLLVPQSAKDAQVTRETEPNAPRLGEPGPRHATAAEKNAPRQFDDDREGPAHDREHQAERTTSRRMAVGGGALAIAIMVVLTLPEIRGFLGGEVSDPTDVAVTPTSVPEVRLGAITSAARTGTPTMDREVTQDDGANPAPVDRLADTTLPEPVAETALVQPDESLLDQGPTSTPMPVLTSAEAPESDASGETGPRPQSSFVISQLDDVRRVQAMLTELGYDPGPIDGVMGAKTIAALRRYQSAGAPAPAKSNTPPAVLTAGSRGRQE